MIKIGLIGSGKWGLNHLKSLRKINSNLIAISDIDIKKKKLADDHNIEFFEDYKQMLKIVEAVVITTPTDTHYEIVSECLFAGKNVLVEKPIALTSKQSKKLVDIAKLKDLILSVGYLYRFNNSIVRLKELIQNIGEIQYITSRYIHSTKPPRKDSGVILNLGIHPIDILNFVTGIRPFKVYAKKKNLLSPQFEDSAIILFDYKNFFATLELSCTHPEKKRDIWVIAEKEKIYVDYFYQKIIRFPIQISYENIKRNPAIEEDIIPNESLRDELNYFIKLIENKEHKKIINMENIGKEDYYTTRICEFCVESAKTGKEMIIN